MKYLKPLLYIDKACFNFAAYCGSGNEASSLGCKSGPEASSGCGTGAAAGIQCLSGAAAGHKCVTGAAID